MANKIANLNKTDNTEESLLYKHSVTYNTAALLLYFMSMEIPFLLPVIRDKSPETSKNAPEDSLLTPEQIEEASGDATGFVKTAILTAAKRQMALNHISQHLDKIKSSRSQLEGTLATVLQNQNQAPENALDDLYLMLDGLRNQEDQLTAMQTDLQTAGNSINTLLEQHSAEWQQHQKYHAEKLIAELASKDIELNELEKQELLYPQKTSSEIKEALDKVVVAANKKIKLEDQPNFTLRTWDTLANVGARQLKDIVTIAKETLQTTKILETLPEEAKAVSELKTIQERAYQEINKTIEKVASEINNQPYGLPPEDLSMLEKIADEIKRKQTTATQKEESALIPE